MKFEIVSISSDTERGSHLYVAEKPKHAVNIGDVYEAKGGSRKKCAYWIVIAVNQRSQVATVIGVDLDGNVKSATNYYTFVLAHRIIVGHCRAMKDIRYKIEQPAPAAARPEVRQ